MTRLTRSGGRRAHALAAFHFPASQAVEALEERVLLSTYMVVNASDSGPGSLRQAILDANAHPGADTINFKIPGVGVQTIAPASPLPVVTETVTIDGTTQPGYSPAAGAPVIEISGANAGPAANGLVFGTTMAGTLNATRSIAEALIVNRFAHDGIVLSALDDQVKGCYIGLDSTGDVAAPNGGNGITVAFGGAVIGGSTTADRNVISGNLLAGIDVQPSGSLSTITGNYVGTNAIGSAAVGNGHEGIRAAGVITIGGAGPLGNVISGNGYSGIYVEALNSDQISVEGNKIGADAAGETAIGNGSSVLAPYRDGITVAGIASIGLPPGGGSPALGNVISGNFGSGVAVSNSFGGARIGSNLIGTDATGTKPLGNAGDGIIAYSPSNVGTIAEGNTGGSVLATGGNLISGNGHDGVLLVGQSGILLYNYIGTNLAGTAAIPNAANGVEVQGFGGSLGYNLISGNGGNGILISHSVARVSSEITGNLIGTDATGNAAVGNAGDGILIVGGAGAVITGNRGSQVISGNGGAGIAMLGGTLGGNSGRAVVSGNYIGTNSAGTAPLGNGGNGISEFDAGDNIANNVISANQGSGVFLGEVTAPTTAGDQVSGNNIGTDAAGNVAAGMGNAGDGVTIFRSSHNSIGMAQTQTANVIAGNGGNGVTVDSGGIAGNPQDFPASTAFNLISRNSIFSNGKLGIDLGNDGVTPNHPNNPSLLGPNNLEDFPVILSATAYPSYTLVRYELVTPASTVEFFSNAASDPSGYGEGQHFVASAVAEAPGTPLTLRLPPLPVGTFVSATAIDSSNDTSEFAQDVTVIAPPPTVTHSAFTRQNNTITFSFSKDVSASLSPSSIRVHNQTTGTDVAVTGVTYDSPSNTATFQLPGNLPGGSYVVTLLARGVSDASGEQLDGNADGTPGDDYTFTFSYASGDVNLDGAVSFDDLLILASHFGQAGTFAEGDLNHDGVINFADLLILAQGYSHNAAATLLPA